MKITIITIVKNGSTLIERTIQSVVTQTYRDLEYIVIDGGSDDGSFDIIKKYDKKITTFISEKDKGISDAFNKGLAHTHGEWILFLNAGDYFHDSKTLEMIAPLLEQPTSVNVVYGKIAYVNHNGTILKYSGDEHYKKRIRWHMPFPHQSTFHRKTLFDTYGFFDLSFKRTMDYEFILRIKKLNALFIPNVISYMLLGGVSQTNYKALFKELERAHRMHFPDSVLNVKMHYFYMLWRVRLILVVRFIFGKRLV